MSEMIQGHTHINITEDSSIKRRKVKTHTYVDKVDCSFTLVANKLLR